MFTAARHPARLAAHRPQPVTARQGESTPMSKNLTIDTGARITEIRAITDRATDHWTWRLPRQIEQFAALRTEIHEALTHIDPDLHAADVADYAVRQVITANTDLCDAGRAWALTVITGRAGDDSKVMSNKEW